MFTLKDIDFSYKITKSISISPVQLQDDQALYQHICRESSDLRPWCPWLEGLNSLIEVQTFLRRYNQQLRENNYFRLGLYHHHDLIGWVSAFDFNWADGCYDLGYWIALPYRKKGYTLYTIKFMMSLLSHIFDLKIVYILCKKDNHPSRLLAHRLHAKRVHFIKNSTLRLYRITL